MSEKQAKERKRKEERTKAGAEKAGCRLASLLYDYYAPSAAAVSSPSPPALAHRSGELIDLLDDAPPQTPTTAASSSIMHTSSSSSPSSSSSSTTSSPPAVVGGRSSATIAAAAAPSPATLRGSHNGDVVVDDDDDAPAAMPDAGLGGLGPHATSKDEVYSTMSRIGVGAGLSFLVRRTVTRRRQSKKSQTRKHRRGDDDSSPAPYQMLLPAPASHPSQPGVHVTQPAVTRSHGLAAPLEASVQRRRAPVDPLVPSASRRHSLTTSWPPPSTFPTSTTSSTARGDHQQSSMDALLRLFLPSDDDDDDANDDGARQLVASDRGRLERFEAGAAAAAASPRLLTVAQDLHLWAIAMSHLQGYRSNLWPIVPLNPTCLLEDSIKMVLSSEGQGATPLSLSVHIGLSLGAILAGHTQLAVEFRMKAREELSHIFDQPEYAIAQALVAMAYLDVRLGREELGEAGSQHLYFLKLATTLCRQIGAQNSDVYLRSLIILAQVDTNSEEATAELHREYAQMERYPYDPLFSLNRHSQDIIPISPTALSRITYSGRIILQAVLGVKLARQQLDRAEREGRTETVARLHDTFRDLLDLMDRTETQFQQFYREYGGQSNPEFSDSVYVSLQLYLYSLRAECWRSLSQPQIALGWANEFLRVGSLPASIYASNGSVSIFSMVDVIRDMHEVDSMRQLLQILDRWVVAFPALRTAKRRCAAVLASPAFSSSSAPPQFPALQPARLPTSAAPSPSSSSSSSTSSFSLALSSYPDPRIT